MLQTAAYPQVTGPVSLSYDLLMPKEPTLAAESFCSSC